MRLGALLSAVTLVAALLAGLSAAAAVGSPRSGALLQPSQGSLLEVAHGAESSSTTSSSVSASLAVPHSASPISLHRAPVSAAAAQSFIASLRSMSSHQLGSMLETGDAKNASASAGKGNSTMTPAKVVLVRDLNRLQHVAAYYGIVNVGGNPFKIMFDTGSCEFWVPSTECTTPRCMRHARYPFESLPRFKSGADASSLVAVSSGARLAAAPLNITYISGRVQGPTVFETVSVGGITARDLMVGLAKRVDVNILDTVAWDGIMGLAYPSPAVLAKGVIPPFEHLMRTRALTAAGRRNQFAIHIADKGGSFTLGGADCSVFSTDGGATYAPGADCSHRFAFAPVTRKEYWTVDLEDVWARSPDGSIRRGLCDGRKKGSPCRAIVDSGTYLVYGPGNHVRMALPGAVAGCNDMAALPDLIFRVKTSPGAPPVELTLKPEEYVLRFGAVDPRAPKEECVLGVAADNDAQWTLGQVFLRAYYALFDRDNNRLGFAKIHGVGAKPIALTELGSSAEITAEAASRAEAEAEVDADADADADADMDADVDMDADADMDSEVDVDADEEVDVDAEVDEEGEAEDM